jgi:hypothetical protein
MACLAVVAACAPTPSASPTGSGAAPLARGPGWHRLAAGPLVARHQAHAFWTGSEVLVLGGSDAPPCPPNADCALPDIPPRRDGAGFDPTTETWRAIADAPLPLGFGSGAALDGTVFLWLIGIEPGAGVREALLAYDVAGNAWREVDVPDAIPPSTRLVAAGPHLAMVATTHEQGRVADLLYDPAADTWSDLPADPIGPAFDRSLVWTGQALVLLGIPLARPAAGPSLYRAAAWDPGTGEWQRLPDSDVMGWDPAWWWVDRRIVNATPGSSDGGQVNGFGRDVAHGGILDPAAGWRPLPEGPKEPGRFEVAGTAGAEHVVAGGWVLHVPTGRWWELPEPVAGLTASAATWAGDRLFLFGGVSWAGNEGRMLDDTWVWLP